MNVTNHTPTPLALLFASVIARDETDRAIDFARLSAAAARASDYRAAGTHAEQCLAARAGWDEETLSHNIESNFHDLSIDDCDDIARAALAKVQG